MGGVIRKVVGRDIRFRPPSLRLLMALLCLPLAAVRAQDAASGQSEGMLFGAIPVVTGASRYEQDADEAPASVTVITAEEIARQGWRTLADALNSVRGFYTSYDRNYTYLGIRGLSQPDDFNTRVLLLLDGQRMNENVGGTVYLATESPVEMGLVDHIEVIRGPGSSLYGTGAFFAVINVVTRRGRDLQGAEVEGALQSFGGRQVRGTVGNRFRSGLEVLASGTLFRSTGQDLFFPEFDSAATNFGRAIGIDGDRRDEAMLKASQGSFTAVASYSRRRKQVPTASYGTSFNSTDEFTVDENLMAALQFAPELGQRTHLETALSWNGYNFDAIYPYPGDDQGDNFRGRWWRAEANLSFRAGQSHTLIVGGEYQLNARQDLSSTDLVTHTSFFHNTATENEGALFAQDEMRFGSHVLVNAGLRYDRSASDGANVNPRLALIYHRNGSAFKLLAGRAFRAPTHFEEFFTDGVTQKAAGELKPERIWNLEATVDRRLSARWRVSASAYFSEIRHLITALTDPVDSLVVFQNEGSIDARGIELEAAGSLGTTSVRASYSYQRSYDRNDNEPVANSPDHLAKLNVSQGLWHDHLTLAGEVLGVSRRTNALTVSVPGHVVVDATLRTQRWLRGLTLGVSVFNLFDAHYGDPSAPEHRQVAIPQDGRSVRVDLTAAF